MRKRKGKHLSFASLYSRMQSSGVYLRFSPFFQPSCGGLCGNGEFGPRKPRPSSKEKTMRMKYRVNWKRGFVLSVLIVLPVYAGNRMKCDVYLNTGWNNDCGNPPPAGVCPGRCDRYTYSPSAGVCVWTGKRSDNCTQEPIFTIVETHEYIFCRFDAEPTTGTYWCTCDGEPDLSRTTTQTKIANCH